MSLKLYNSLTRRVEDFTPIDPRHVGMYVCGPTVYDRAHVGNARPVVVFDVLFRLMQRRYEKVTYVRNITDIDDKIIARATANREEISQLTERTTKFYHADMAALNTLPPTVEPRATTHVSEMIGMIETLITNGHAYEAERNVLFSIATDSDYGKLSGRNRDEQIAGARVEVAPYKKDPADFVLWKPFDEMPCWDSPWGKGRPSWHIECSAMAKKHLGETFDIHGGGIDLIFPHHENEIAQSTCANHKPLANMWMHNGHVVVGGQKMSKSLGNFITVEQLLQRWPGEVIRLALLSAHYRQPLDITEDLLAASKARLDYCYGVLRRGDVSSSAPVGALEAALNDDLNTPQALTVMQEIAASGDTGALKAAGDSLGLLQSAPEDWFRWQPPATDGLNAEAIEDLVKQRTEARAARNFARADEIRQTLLAQGIELEDSAGGTFWRRS